MIFSVQSEWKFSIQSIFEIGAAQTSKIDAILWWDMLESNEGNGISFDLLFTDDTENADVFINCCDLCLLNVMIWVDRDPSS